MERESFEDEQVATLLNKHFVAIKVDREERPDIDHIYMSVCQMMTGEGGWPLTVVMTPDKRPFFAGTYFPKAARYGRIGLMELLPRLVQAWREEQDQIDEIGRNIIAHLSQPVARGVTRSGRSSVSQPTESQPSATWRTVDQTTVNRPNTVIFDDACEQFALIFDPDYGGFGRAPKFPSPHNLSFLIRHHALQKQPVALQMALKTLSSMYAGGIWDHVGYGFARYSTDERWLVPHFEKMLYDNALIAHAYLDAYQASGDEFYGMVARRIFTYVLRDMTSQDGAFYSAQDADSEGIEGKFYIFTKDEIYGALDEQTADWVCDLYGVTAQGNFEGGNILNLLDGRIEREKQEPSRVDAAMGILREKRDGRVHPHLDDKILTSWNALMISALAKGALALNEKAWLDAAIRAYEWIKKNLIKDGRILARFRDGEARHKGYLDDYAYLAFAQLELFGATQDPSYLVECVQVAKDMQRLFYDENNGGFFFTGFDAEVLLARPKEWYDGAMPAGNSVAAYVLASLCVITGDADLMSLRDVQMKTGFEVASRQPTGYSFFLMALQRVLYPTQEVVIVPGVNHDAVREMASAVREAYRPLTTLIIRDEKSACELEKLAPFTASQHAQDGLTTAYVCENFACHLPVTTTADLKSQLDQL